MPRTASSTLSRGQRSTLMCSLLLSAASVVAPAAQATEPPSRLSLTVVSPENPGTASPPEEYDARLASLRAAVEASPKDRAARYELVRALMDATAWDDALAAARDWRAHDAYDLVVVRLLGDIYREMGREDDALRTYSAVTELLPRDPEAQRALATVLKQRGDLDTARGRLARAVELRPDDHRLAFELADVELRLGEVDSAQARLLAIVNAEEVSEQVRHPARQRLAQVYATHRRQAISAGDAAATERWQRDLDRLEVEGGVDNDIKIYLSWDTNRTDVDLWVTTPSGEKVWYQKRRASDGSTLYDDVTAGYGPESFTVPSARAGTYRVQVNYYGTQRQTFTEARGEVVVVLDEGRAGERQRALPYVLRKPGQTVTVAEIEVE